MYRKDIQYRNHSIRIDVLAISSESDLNAFTIETTTSTQYKDTITSPLSGLRSNIERAVQQAQTSIDKHLETPKHEVILSELGFNPVPVFIQKRNEGRGEQLVIRGED